MTSPGMIDKTEPAPDPSFDLLMAILKNHADRRDADSLGLIDDALRAASKGDR